MHQTCTGTKKNKKNKPLDAPNLHRHQKKPKKLKIPGTMGPLLSSCWNFWFFWCLSMFGASSGLFFLVFLVPANVSWSQSHQTCTSTKKTKKTKPLDAPNLHRHQKNQKNSKFQELWVHFWNLSTSSGLVFLVFLVPVNVLWSQSHQTCTGTKKTKKTKPLDAPNLHRHQKKQKN